MKLLMEKQHQQLTSPTIIVKCQEIIQNYSTNKHKWRKFIIWKNNKKKKNQATQIERQT